MSDASLDALARLRAWGWNSARDQNYEPVPGCVPARVIAQHRGEYRIVTPAGDAVGVAPGRMLYRASGRHELPAVGDWILVEPEQDGPATIIAILPRTTQFVRRRAGTENAEQVIAANVDTVFIMSSLNQDLSPRRTERYLAATWESGAQPVIVLTKSDLVEDPSPAKEALAEIAGGAPIHVISSATGDGLDPLGAYLQPGLTVVLLGSSGVGKSTLVNRLAGREVLKTQTIREADDKGRHTTTHREIFQLPDGALVLDTPGMRELGLVEAEQGVDDAFEDVHALVGGCKFSDCAHGPEPGCAVRAAIAAGKLPAARWESYTKLLRESAYEVRRKDAGLTAVERDKWKQIHKDMRRKPKRQ